MATSRTHELDNILLTSTRRLSLQNNRLDLNTANQEMPGFLRGAGVKELNPIIEINCQP